MKVKEIIHKKLYTIPTTASASDAAKMMDEHNIGAILVTENNNIIGIVTEWDIVRKVIGNGRDPKEVTVDEIKNFPLLIIDADAPIEEAHEIMVKQDVRRIGVMEKGQIIGIISRSLISANTDIVPKTTK